VERRTVPGETEADVVAEFEALQPTSFAASEIGSVAAGTGVGSQEAMPGKPVTLGSRSLQTSVPGVFAVGDVRGGAPKRVAAAVGEGSVAVGQIHAYLTTRTTGAERLSRP
jgi:thioredoxin reductase